MIPDSHEYSLAGFVNAAWLPRIKARKASWKRETNIAQNHILPPSGSKSLARITESDVRRWLLTFEREYRAAATRNRRLHVLKSIFRLAAEHGVRPADRARRVQSRHVKKALLCHAMEDGRLEALLSVLHPQPGRKAKAITLIMLSGAQKPEILNARWESIFLDGDILLAPTGGVSTRKIRLSNPARTIFAQSNTRMVPRGSFLERTCQAAFRYIPILERVA